MIDRTGLLTLAAFLAFAPCSPAQEPPPAGAPITRPGATAEGFLLPNGWTVSPAGRQVSTTDLPLNIIPMPDARHALVATSGYNAHELSLVDLQKGEVVAKRSTAQSWFGLALAADGRRAWWSGGGGRSILAFDIEAGEPGKAAIRPAPGELSDETKRQGAEKPKAHFRSGLLLDPARRRIVSLDIQSGTIAAIDPETGREIRSARAGIRPYDAALSRDGKAIYVSDWAGRAVLVLDAEDLKTTAKIAVGEHPNQVAVHPTDGRLFVACASSNCVSVIDARRGAVVETIHTALFPKAPEGSTPDALAIAPDGKTLYVANADNNCVAVIDVAEPARSQVKGFIPTGWYPTAVAVTPDGRSLLVGVGKGNRTKPNPRRKEAEKPRAGDEAGAPRRMLPFPYIGTTLSGALSIVPIPDDAALAAHTEKVYRNCPYSDRLLAASPHPERTAIPTKVGDPSPIRYVLYIIKENRTYDQVLGDLPRGDGDPSLVMFGREVTPNHHKLAEEFVLLDNLYCNGHVSADGHPWSTMAYNTDYIARNWALTYSSRKGIEDDEEADLAKAPSGYLWDASARAGISYRSYGEYGRRVSQPDGTLKMEAAVPGLVGHVCPDYGVAKVPGKKVRDTENAETFLREYRAFEEAGTMPRLIVMSLGEDHTTGTRAGTFTPQACVASNDLALGRIVEAVSHGKHWAETAIFVIEDDAQNGPDHVDAHRTVGLVISPYTRRKHLDSSQYSTTSLLRTMELILGLPPLSQHDAAARPMFASFTDRADLAPYSHEPARIDVDAVNAPTAYGAERSAKMDFDEYDRIDDFELNEILWRSVKGPDAPVPPAARRAIAFRPASR
ncbi:Phosphoesterase family protein [Aquisphaera giovannonii]|uniref:Phosphoesterase family protein n=2 Tax=Aquisphaera giovannonii TaxID=406548 RepID=A0A5B9VWU0_9BACT|nr:Phosphoesterase family protein [Aquisphaera giovannonii]